MVHICEKLMQMFFTFTAKAEKTYKIIKFDKMG